jgi:hypothetical protein
LERATLTGQVKHWPTPNAQDGERGAESRATKKARGAGGDDAGREAQETIFVVCLAYRDEAIRAAAAIHRGSQSSQRLRNQVHWPTPAGRDERDDGNYQAAQNRKSPCLPAAAVVAGLLAQGSRSTGGKPRGCLNSRWVAQLQGYPSDWYDVPTATP